MKKETTIDPTLVPDHLKDKMDTVALAYDPAFPSASLWTRLWQELDTLERLWQDDLLELMTQVPELCSMVEALRDGLSALLR